MSDFAYVVTPDGVLFKFQSNGNFRSYHLSAVTRSVWQGGMFHLYFGEDDHLVDSDDAAEALMREYCKFAGLQKVPVAVLVGINGSIASANEIPTYVGTSVSEEVSGIHPEHPTVDR